MKPGTHRIGFGFDVHRFATDGRHLILGGVDIAGHSGLEGHSDADVLSHATTDALLGAAGLGDMGEHFPDTDVRWQGANSLELLGAAAELVRESGWLVENVDCTVVLDQPKIAPHKKAMEKRLSAVVHAPVNVKASRAEGLGAIGRLEGAACYAVALLVADATTDPPPEDRP